jgi:hypothetical protein
MLEILRQDHLLESLDVVDAERTATVATEPPAKLLQVLLIACSTR